MSAPQQALSEVLIEARPGFACGDDVADGVFQFRMNNITVDGGLDFSKKRRVPRATRNIDSYFVERGDVLFNATNSPDLVGKTAYFNGIEEPAVFSNHFLRLRPDPRKLDGRFLSRWINLQYERGRFKAMCRQWVNQATVNRDGLLAMRIPLPPLAEQRRIAEILDKADALRAKRRAALAQLDSLTQSIFLDMFGHPLNNGKRWPKKELGEVAREKPNNGIFRKNPEYIHNGNDGLPVVWVEELFRGDSIDTRNSRRVIASDSDVEKYGLKTGDILFCRSSLKLDGIAFNNVYMGEDFKALFECHLIRISPNLKIVSPVYLNCLLRLPPMRAVARAKSKTATMTTIDQQGLCSIELPIPPIDLQCEFARRIASVEGLKVTHRASVVELDALFASLQHRAFRGEL